MNKNHMDPNAVWVLGVGMSQFYKSGQPAPTYVELGSEAAKLALNDADVSLQDVDAAVASYCYGDPACGQRVLAEIGLTGLPVVNVNNNCCSGSTALYLAAQMVRAREHQAVLAVGFEQMERNLSSRYPEKPDPCAPHINRMYNTLSGNKDPLPGMNAWTGNVIKMFAGATLDYVQRYPQTPPDLWLTVARKSRLQGQLNPRALLKDKALPDPEAKPLDPPLTVAMAAQTASGGAAALLVSTPFLHRWLDAAAVAGDRAKRGRPLVQLVAQACVGDTQDTFTNGCLELIGTELAHRAANQVFARSGLRPSDVDVVELHDCFSPNEVFLAEALGLANRGGGHELYRDGEWRNGLFYVGRRWVINPSGGLLSRGHPLGATGLAQCHELTTQLRGDAESARQVPHARVALQHNYGLGSACIVSLYTRHDTTPPQPEMKANL